MLDTRLIYVRFKYNKHKVSCHTVARLHTVPSFTCFRDSGFCETGLQTSFLSVVVKAQFTRRGLINLVQISTATSLWCLSLRQHCRSLESQMAGTAASTSFFGAHYKHCGAPLRLRCVGALNTTINQGLLKHRLLYECNGYKVPQGF